MMEKGKNCCEDRNARRMRIKKGSENETEYENGEGGSSLKVSRRKGRGRKEKRA